MEKTLAVTMKLWNALFFYVDHKSKSFGENLSKLLKEFLFFWKYNGHFNVQPQEGAQIQGSHLYQYIQLKWHQTFI